MQLLSIAEPVDFLPGLTMPMQDGELNYILTLPTQVPDFRRHTQCAG